MVLTYPLIDKNVDLDEDDIKVKDSELILRSIHGLRWSNLYDRWRCPAGS